MYGAEPTTPTGSNPNPNTNPNTNTCAHPISRRRYAEREPRLLWIGKFGEITDKPYYRSGIALFYG
jgi:hypothetical protein